MDSQRVCPSPISSIGLHSSDSEDNERDIDLYIEDIRKPLLKTLSMNVLEPILSQLKDRFIAKNVTEEIAVKLCESVSTQLDGMEVNAWVPDMVHISEALEDSRLLRLLESGTRNILRDVRAKSSPYAIVFCGVNGVGKSTNLVKIANWLIVNDVRVLVIACDTFKAGAIDELVSHIMTLKNIHEKDGKSKIDLFKKSYGKDSAAIAMEGIKYARTAGYKCCLVDTAGQCEEESQMKDLAKLMVNSQPDLTLFVEKAVINKSLERYKTFTDSLKKRECFGITSNSSPINGIILTHMDNICESVGIALSMLTSVGSPIMFVSKGKNFRDLRQLTSKGVVRALLQ